MGKKAHTAIVEWDGYSWIATPDIGGVTQTKRLDLVRVRLSEVARLVTGEKIDPDEWTLLIHFAGILGKEGPRVRDFRARVEAEEEHRARVTRATAVALRHRRMHPWNIGTMMGRLTHQRASPRVASKARSKTKKSLVRCQALVDGRRATSA